MTPGPRAALMSDSFTQPQPVQPIPVIGLLGGPGAGKSYLAGLFEQLGGKVIDADTIAREALELPEVRATLVEWWGPDILTADGRIDRPAVGRRVFEAPGELARLESLIHPRVNAKRQELREQYRSDPAVTAIIEDCPLLLERGLNDDGDVLVFVEASRETREKRVLETREWSAAELDRREKNQLPLDIKRGRADYVFDSEADPIALATQAREILVKASTTRTD